MNTGDDQPETSVESTVAAKKITDAIMASEEFAIEAWLRPVAAGFGSHDIDRDHLAGERSIMEFDRFLGARDDGEFVGGAGAYSFEMTLPGGTTAPAAGVTAVSVAPTHRRRGILTGLMERQLVDVAARGEPFAVLNASEADIYRRFGYGAATTVETTRIATERSQFTREPDTAGDLALLTREEAAKLLHAFFDEHRLRVPGALSRTEAWWGIMTGELESWKGGGKTFHVVHRTAGAEVDGFAIYTVSGGSDNFLAAGEVEVRELYGADPEVEAALWRYCYDIDLVTTVRALRRPPDDHLRLRLADPRQLQVTGSHDLLWVRVVDVAAALAARRYSGEGSLVLEVDDAFRPDSGGRFRLVGGPDGAECERTTDEPDLSLSVPQLGATVLGGVPFWLLRRAGLIQEHRRGAAADADAMFVCRPAPYCTAMF